MKRLISSIIVRRAGIFVSALFIGASVFGAPVTQQKAAKAAETFIVRAYPAVDQKAAQTVTKFGKSHLAVHKVRPLIQAGQLIGFVADLKPSGYVLLSADDEAPSIKLHADNGAFDSLPPAILRVIGLELAEDLSTLAELKRLHKPVDPKHKQLWSALTEPAAHSAELAALLPAGPGAYLLTTSWNQDSPYNRNCPDCLGGPPNLDGRAWAGCNAVAIAQILRYKSLPAAIAQDHTDNDTFGYCHSSLSISGSGMSPYDWNNMPDSISEISPTVQKQAIGRLIRHAAVAMNSDFEAVPDSGGTGAYASYAPGVFRDYFLYSCTDLERKSNYTPTQWYNKIVADINADKPIFYAMQPGNSDIGHVVVCDGYASGNQIHLNFGWGGANNAWYTFSSFGTVVDTNGTWWTDHEAIFGITPPSAAFQVIGDRVEDSTSIRSYNNNNGTLESGEVANIYPRVADTGGSSATHIDVSLVYTGSVLELSTGSRRYPDLAPEDSAEPSSGYYVSNVRKDFTGDVYADVHVQWYENGTNVVVIPNGLAIHVDPAAWLGLNPNQWDFGTATPGATVTHTTLVRNAGCASLQITNVTTSATDTTWTGFTLPCTLAAGQSTNLIVSINTTGMQGQISRQSRVYTTGRVQYPGDDDLFTMSGLVSATVPVNQIPNVTGAYVPDISDDWIVWVDGRNGNSDIYAYNLATGQEKPICTNSASQWGPRIWGNLIAWEDWRNAPTNQDADIYAYDLGRPDLGEFPVLLGGGHADLIGVDSNMVAVVNDYYVFTERHNFDSARNLIVYRYQGSGQFTQIFHSGFTGNSSHNPMQSIEGGGDFAQGLLVVQRHELWWNTEPINDYWDSRNQRLQTINYAAGGTTLVDAGTGWHGWPCAERDRFVYRESDANNDDQIYLRRVNGSVQQLTSTPSVDYAEDVLGIGGTDGSDCVVYDYSSSSRPGLYYLDRSNSQEYIISTALNPSDLRMDNLRVVFIDYNASGSVKYVYLKQADVQVTPPGIAFSQENPVEGTPINISVLVRNLTTYNQTGNVTVNLYDGDPNSGGTSLAQGQTFSGLTANTDRSVTFSNITSLAEGQHNIYAKLTVAASDPANNNKASRMLTVQDSDTEGPIISNVSASEYNGDEDGVISAIEQVTISYRLTDPSGIGSTQLLVDNANATVNVSNTTYYAIVGPLSAGSHQFEIRATDADTSPASTMNTYSFVVAADTDGDGIPDSWMNLYFGHPRGQPYDKSRATDDADGTGQNNKFKYVAGLDPTNSASVFLMNILMNPPLPGVFLLDEQFSADVFASGSWTRTDTSVTVDTANGWLHIASDPGYDDRAEKVIHVPLSSVSPTVIEQRLRLKSGGAHYYLPWEGIYFEDSSVLAVTYLPKLQPSEHFGWAFGTWTDIYDHAVPGEDYWAVTRIVLTSTGGQLFVKPDDAAKSWFSTDFYPIVTTNWSHSSVEKIRFSQPWDAVCDFDYITIQASSPVNKLAAVQFRPVAAGRTYTPQFSTNLTLGGWSPLTGYSGPVTNLDQVTITDTNAVGPQKFYRIKISLP